MATARSRLVPVLLAAGLAMGGLNLAAYAGVGDPLLGGRSNSLPRTTGIASTNGPALTLATRPTAPPLAVSSRTKVKKLNADLVDGLDSAALATTVRTYVLPGASGAGTYRWALTGLPAGTYLATLNVNAVTGASGASVGCGFITTQENYALFNWGGVTGFYSGTATSGVLRVPATGVAVRCQSVATFTTPASSGQVNTVSLQLIDKEIARTSAAPVTE